MAEVCEVCGQPATVQVTEATRPGPTCRALCDAHVPAGMMDQLIACVKPDPWLEHRLEQLRHLASDPLRRSEYAAERERIIAYFEEDLRAKGIAD